MRFLKNHHLDGWPILDTQTQKPLSKDETIEMLNLMNTKLERITQLECSLYLALSALDFEAGEWNEEAIIRHQREQIDIGRDYLRKAFDQEMTDRLSQLFQKVVESRPFDLPPRR
ncbi:hypothetical protein [Nitrincola iocasae]|uniref:Uncharacterized protein n=1 Tax=Nitrincola iocasae TaxID=2614693 RepID=A0A5J6LCL1_9GAMM|nr:hypothetical protein [Nitrincola iocasae]QEW06325.1 hypothetical protein F5I99_07305 [Nitrincola iocasae]